jgi:hypothetical protein
MIRLQLALLAAPLSVLAYLMPHFSFGCMSSQRAFSLSLRPSRVASPVALQMNLGERFDRPDKADINDLSNKNETGIQKLLVQGVACFSLYFLK